MKKFFFVAFMVVLGSFGLNAQVVYEDFEGGMADLAWNGLNGTYNGAVANPDPTGVNTSVGVGSYTNAAAFDFCFALYTFPAVLDLSTYNQFKMKIWSPTAPCKALLKLEGPGGPAVEKFVDITVANQWVEYTFDMSAGAGYTNLKTILVSFNSFVLGDDKTYYFDDIVAEKAEVCYETFESPSGINWIGLNGTFDGAVANPGANQVNSTAMVGSFTNNPAFDYNFAFGTISTGPIDLSVYNQFAMDVYLPAPTSVLFKLEGTGQALEKVKYVPIGGAWQRITFDMSGASAFTTITKILIVFAPGKIDNGLTYYFDNICAYPNACKDAVPNPDILDDFECNRNAAYALGWDSLSVVKNPAPDGTNTSSKVGKWNDPAGNSTEYAALVIASENPIDLSVRNQFGCKVWAPKAGTLLLKIEGGTGAKEVPIQVTEINKWVEYSVDFADQIGKGHRRLVMFFNAGVNGEPGDVYYVDDISLKAPTAAPPLEDFQGGIHLGWQPLDQDATLHGVFTGPTANPKPNSVNNSSQVGCYAKGVSNFSTLQAISLNNLDLSVYPQFNLDVLSPAGGGKVTMQLSSPTQGNKQAEATITTPEQWETLKFDFSAFDGITDFGEIRLLFNAGTAAAGQSWCIDNLRQTEVTIDPCKDVIPVTTIIDDYECQRNYTQIYYGAGDIKVVNNPHLTPDNGSLKVGEYTDPGGPGTEFAGIGIEFPQSPDLTVYNHLQMQVWAPSANVPFLFKLEGGSPAVEIFDTLKTANTWYKFDVDFSKSIGTNNTKLVIFVNVLSATGGGTYYIDNIKWSRAGYNGCIDDHEAPGTTIPKFTYFANGHLETEAYQFEIVSNPASGGINTSSKVGKFVKASDGLPFAGMYADLEAPIDWKGVKTIKGKVLMDHIGNFGVKVEGSQTGAPALELKVPNTKINTWEELSYDFSTVPDNGEYKRLTLFFDLGIDATGTDVTSYFDDLVIGNGNCSIVSVFNPLPLEPMVVSPNPVTNTLRVDNFRDIAHIEVFNMLGQRVASLQTAGELRTEIDVTRFPVGLYSLTGFNTQGTPIGYSKFVKQ